MVAKANWRLVQKDSVWVFLGAFFYELTEGDVFCVFFLYGEIVNVNFVRVGKIGKFKGFCFFCYEDQRSIVLVVDSFNGVKIKGRVIRVDYVFRFRFFRVLQDVDDVIREFWAKGCGVEIFYLVYLRVLKTKFFQYSINKKNR